MIWHAKLLLFITTLIRRCYFRFQTDLGTFCPDCSGATIFKIIPASETQSLGYHKYMINFCSEFSNLIIRLISLYKLPCRLLFFDGVTKPLKAYTSLFLCLTISFVVLKDPPHPNLVSCSPHLCSSPTANLHSHLTSTQTFKLRERLFVRNLWSHCPPPPTCSPSSHSAPFSISIRISEEEKPEIHLSQVSTNLGLLLPADSLALILYNASLAGDPQTCSSGGNPVFMCASHSACSHHLHC